MGNDGNGQPKSAEGPAASEGTQALSRWVINGEEYDLTDFIPKHPGGAEMLLFTTGRDITIGVMTGHKNPEKTVLPILKRYKVPESRPVKEVVKRRLGVPEFLLPPDFEATQDIPTYNFDLKDESLLLNAARKRISAPEVQKTIGQLDKLFDGVIVAIIASYFLLVAAWLGGLVPWYAAVPAFAVLRTGMAAGGHYYVHRRKPHPGDMLFDLNYVGMAYVAHDGHVLLHHMYTQSKADVKRGFFGGMLGIPRLLRIPVHTIHKLGHVTTGMLIRGIELEFEPDNEQHQGVPKRSRKIQGSRRLPFIWEFWVLHLWLRVEMVAAIYCGVGWAWFWQFALTLWLNTLMVSSSHDFREVLEPDCKDWARYQLLNSHDMTITGNAWVDCFLSAGLSPHRAHHIFPYQKSAFANQYTNRHLAVVAKEHNLPWLPPKSWCTEILPEVWGMSIGAPVSDPHSRKPIHSSFYQEHVALAAYKYCIKYIWEGFLGIGSV